MITIAQLTHFWVAATAQGDLFPIGKLILWGIYEISENPKKNGNTKNLGNWNPKILLPKDGDGKPKSLDLYWSDSMPLQGKALDIRLKIAWKYILPFFGWKVAPLHLNVLLFKVP